MAKEKKTLTVRKHIKKGDIAASRSFQRTGTSRVQISWKRTREFGQGLFLACVFFTWNHHERIDYQFHEFFPKKGSCVYVTVLSSHRWRLENIFKVSWDKPKTLLENFLMLLAYGKVDFGYASANICWETREEEENWRWCYFFLQSRYTFFVKSQHS